MIFDHFESNIRIHRTKFFIRSIVNCVYLGLKMIRAVGLREIAKQNSKQKQKKKLFQWLQTTFLKKDLAGVDDTSYYYHSSWSCCERSPQRISFRHYLIPNEKKKMNSFHFPSFFVIRLRRPTLLQNFSLPSSSLFHSP